LGAVRCSTSSRSRPWGNVDLLLLLLLHLRHCLRLRTS
jgi:hypothetical protein